MMFSRIRKRISRAPVIEGLEERRLLSAVPSQARVSEINVNGGIELRVTGTNRADVVTISDNGTGQPGNIQVTVNGQAYISRFADSSIYVMSNGGNDHVTYNLTGNLISARTVIAMLGTGNDQFTANLNYDLQTSKFLDLEANGEAGNDTLKVNQTGMVTAGSDFIYLNGGAGDDQISYNFVGDIAAGAVVGPALLGGAGNDQISLNYSGNVLGQILYNDTIDGGSGSDKLTANLHLGVYSTGKVGTSPTSPAIVNGSDGNDSIQYVVTVDPAATTTQSLAQVFASAQGGPGTDTVLRSSNVAGDPSNENDAVIS